MTRDATRGALGDIKANSLTHGIVVAGSPKYSTCAEIATDFFSLGGRFIVGVVRPLLIHYVGHTFRHSRVKQEYS